MTVTLDSLRTLHRRAVHGSDAEAALKELIGIRERQAQQALEGAMPDIDVKNAHVIASDMAKLGWAGSANPQTWRAIAGICEELLVARAKLHARAEDTERLNYLEAETLSLQVRQLAMADSGDYNVTWRVIGYWEQEPREREMGSGADPRRAIDDARAHPQRASV